MIIALSIDRAEQSPLLPVITALVVFFLGLIYIGITVVGHIPDVWEHVYRVSAISNGCVEAVHVDSVSDFHNSDENVGGYVDWDWIDFSVEYDDGYDPGVVHPETIDRFDENGGYVPFNNTALNSPVAYAPQLVVFVVGRFFGLSPLVKYYGAELLMLFVYAFSCGLAVRVMPRYKLVGMVVCLLPPLAFRYSFAISADSMTQAVCLVYVAFAYRAFLSAKPTRKTLVRLVLSGFLLSWLKLTYLPLLGLSLAAAWYHRKAMPVTHIVWVVAGTVASGVCTIVLMKTNGWFVTTPSVVSFGDVQLKKASLLTDPSWALGDILYSISHFQANNMGNRVAMAVVWGLLTFAIVISIAAFLSAKARKPHLRERSGPVAAVIFCLVGLALSIVVLLLVYLALWMQYTPITHQGVDGLQFRYANPLVLIVLLAFATSVDVVMAGSAKKTRR